MDAVTTTTTPHVALRPSRFTAAPQDTYEWLKHIEEQFIVDSAAYRTLSECRPNASTHCPPILRQRVRTFLGPPYGSLLRLVSVEVSAALVREPYLEEFLPSFRNMAKTGSRVLSYRISVSGPWTGLR